MSTKPWNVHQAPMRMGGNSRQMVPADGRRSSGVARARRLPIAVAAVLGTYAVLTPLLMIDGGLGLVILGVLGLGFGAGVLVRTWWWPVVFPLPLVGAGVWMLQAQTWYERVEMGSFAAGLLMLLGFLFLVLAVVSIVPALLGVMVGKRGSRG